jgi:lipopolysaccharide/colanic/teichoic acid biosynthesis glycosyltransferase
MHRVGRGLLCAGVLAAIFGLGKLHATAHDYDLSSSFRLPWSIAFAAILMVTLYGAGLPELRTTAKDAWVGALGAVGAATGVVSLLQLLTGDALLPRAVVFGSAAIVAPWAVACTRLTSDHATRSTERDRAVLVAEPSDHLGLVDELARAPERRAQVVGFLTPAAASTESGGTALVDLVRASDATVVVLNRQAQIEESVVAQAGLLHEAGVRVRTLSMFYEEWLWKLPVSELERISLLFDISEVHRLRYGRMKRIVDLAFALAGLVALVLVTPIVVVGNVVANRGPLLFRQERIGKGGSRFRMLKFRTMVPGATGNAWTEIDDPRITPFGRFLRRSHLDELPQVLNILTGDLSVVGPRPEQPGYVTELTSKLPFYDLRHLVRPGLTGWAQVKYGYAGDERDALEKLQYEFFYLRHQRIGLDARIIVRTVRSVAGGLGSGR